MGSDDETRRRRTASERQAIVTEAFAEGHSASEVAESHGVSTASIYLWRRQLLETSTGDARKPPRRRPSADAPAPVALAPVSFAPVRITPVGAAPSPTTLIGHIEIALANGRILKVCETIDPVRLVRLVAALEGRA